MTLDPVYRITDFRFRYPDSNCKINWSGEHHIYPGERILLTGASGSGKSTLLYGLMGLIPETVYGEVSGDILFRGNSIIKDPELIIGKAGLILQNPAAQMLCYSVREELAYGLENLKKPVNEIIKTINEWSDKFGVTDLLDRETRTLSGGEKQKITLLSILMTNPEILMLDEPTAFLDPQSSQEIMDIVKDYSSTNMLIFVEHNLSYLKHIVNRNLHLEIDGQVCDRQADMIEWDKPLPHLPASSSGKILMQLSTIRFAYEQAEILKGIDLEISSGEIISITGRNGCGKSTLLSIISGLRTGYQGNIEVFGNTRSTNDKKILRKLTGLLFQNPDNHFLYNQVEKELSNNEIDYLTKEFASKKDQSPFTLSEGEKRRLSTAIAYQKYKKLLLLDEPTFGQDFQNKVKLIELLGKLRDNGIGIVIVSHDDKFVEAVSNRILVLKHGILTREKSQNE